MEIKHMGYRMDQKTVDRKKNKKKPTYHTEPELAIELQQELAQHGYGNDEMKPVFLGQGAMSQVWRVWDDAEKCFAACKISEAGNRAEREAHLLRAMEHPVFPEYRQAWQWRDKFFLVMEYIPGNSVAEMVCRRGGFSWKQAVHIAMELAEGLLYLHERSEPIVFRDIKPDNVMLRQDGRVKLIDIGCACPEGDNKTFAGSKGYGAPEQFTGTAGPGVESDVYAMGCLLYYMLTGEERKGSFKGIPYGLRRLIEESVCEDRRQRIPDMRSYMEILSVYEKTNKIRHFAESLRARAHISKNGGFYYVKNVQIGMDNQKRM